MSLAALIDELNPQQKQAATTEAKHSLVLAGAGCGKT
ncbi:UvrD-helicase domain-containing protein, partial [Acinetobacter sp. RF14B]